MHPVSASSPLDELVDGLSRDHGVHPYGKWRGAFWRLVSLADLGVEPDRPGALAAAEHALARLASPRRLRRIHARRIRGRVRRCATQDGLGLWACLRAGVRDDRPDVLAESLVETQWPDGGWNCDVRPRACHSSFNETWGPLLGLAEHGGATQAVERAAELLLEHRVFRSHRTGQPAHPAFLRRRPRRPAGARAVGRPPRRACRRRARRRRVEAAPRRDVANGRSLAEATRGAREQRRGGRLGRGGGRAPDGAGAFGARRGVSPLVFAGWRRSVT